MGAWRLVLQGRNDGHTLANSEGDQIHALSQDSLDLLAGFKKQVYYLRESLPAGFSGFPGHRRY